MMFKASMMELSIRDVIPSADFHQGSSVDKDINNNNNHQHIGTLVEREVTNTPDHSLHSCYQNLNTSSTSSSGQLAHISNTTTSNSPLSRHISRRFEYFERNRRRDKDDGSTTSLLQPALGDPQSSGKETRLPQLWLGLPSRIPCRDEKAV
jgi:hypothetical protein